MRRPSGAENSRTPTWVEEDRREEEEKGEGEDESSKRRGKEAFGRATRRLRGLGMRGTHHRMRGLMAANTLYK
jgi:hypothetical protein